MMLWIRLSLRNALRNVRRTLLTAATILVGIALAVVSLAWLGGIFQGIIADYTMVAGEIRLVTDAYAEREALQPLYENIADVEPVLKTVREAKGVVAAEAKISMGAVVTVGEEIGDNFGLVTGASDTWYKDYLKGPDKVGKGTWLTGAKGEAVIGYKLAEQMSAKVGDELLVLGQTQYGSMSPVTAKVVGIVGGDPSLGYQVFLPMEEVQWMADIPQGAIEILVYTDGYDPAVVTPVAEGLDALPGLDGLKVDPWFTRGPFATMLPVLDGMQGFIQFLIVFMTALAIFNTMTMSVMERTGEIGVMRAMGLSRLGAMGLFLVESLTIGAIGGIAGVVVGAIPAYYLATRGVTLPPDMIEKMGSSFPFKATFYAILTPEILVQGLVLGLVIAVVGAILPAFRAASIQPVTAMHARR